MSISMKPGPISSQSAKVRTGTNFLTRLSRVVFFLRPPEAISLTGRSSRSIVAALMANSCSFTPSCKCRCPCRSMASINDGNKDFSRLPQIRSDVSHRTIRSEEHTSELQSLRHLVCRLLLEKKKSIYLPPCCSPDSFLPLSVFIREIRAPFFPLDFFFFF